MKGIHPGEGGIFNFPSGGDGQTGPVRPSFMILFYVGSLEPISCKFPLVTKKNHQVRLTNLTPISPTNEDVYSSPELRSNPQPPIQVRVGREFQRQPLPVALHAGLLPLAAARGIPLPFRPSKSKHLWHERKLTHTTFLYFLFFFF